jgi:hypothetical protein
VIPTEKVCELGKRLLEKSRGGHVTWEYSQTRHNSIEKFRISMPEAVIELERVPTPEGDDVRLYVRRDDGMMVGMITAEDGKEVFELLADLYAEAERRVTRWDQILERVEKRLATPGVVGVPVPTVDDKPPF